MKGIKKKSLRGRKCNEKKKENTKESRF